MEQTVMNTSGDNKTIERDGNNSVTYRRDNMEERCEPSAFDQLNEQELKIEKLAAEVEKLSTENDNLRK